jgi:hypothetical protein
VKLGEPSGTKRWNDWKKKFTLKQTEQKHQETYTEASMNIRRVTNSVKDENGNHLTDYHNILNRCKNYFCQLIHVRGVNDVRQTEMYTDEPLVLDSCSVKSEIAI